MVLRSQPHVAFVSPLHASSKTSGRCSAPVVTSLGFVVMLHLKSCLSQFLTLDVSTGTASVERRPVNSLNNAKCPNASLCWHCRTESIQKWACSLFLRHLFDFSSSRSPLHSTAIAAPSLHYVARLRRHVYQRSPTFFEPRTGSVSEIVFTDRQYKWRNKYDVIQLYEGHKVPKQQLIITPNECEPCACWPATSR